MPNEEPVSLIKWIRESICGKQKRQYKPIQYSKPGTPKENSRRLIEYVAQDFEGVQNRTEHQCQLFGRFMGIVLLIEIKLVRLLSNFDKQIEERMFGQKIEVYKDFLKAFNWANSNQEIEEFRALIAPMKEIKSIRDAMAHDLSKVSINSAELQQTVSYIRNQRPDLFQTFSHAKDEELKSISAIAVFGFLFSERLAGIRCELQ